MSADATEDSSSVAASAPGPSRLMKFPPARLLTIQHGPRSRKKSGPQYPLTRRFGTNNGSAGDIRRVPMADADGPATGGVPFAHHARVDVLEIGEGTGRARMPDSPELRNHIQSLHAGALFTLGETASGSAMLGAF